MENIIGKHYYPKDNSFIVSLCDGSKNVMLAACHLNNYEEAKCTILTQPFKANVHIIELRECEKTMVIVEYNGYAYSVLWNENWFIPKSTEEI